MTTIKKFRWFWAWDDEKEEMWLRQMSQQGWHFQSVSLPGNYRFKQGEPIDYVYRLDHFVDRKDMGNYLQIFMDAGWDYLGEMNGWQYFRQESIKGEAPEIYTDNASKAKKYQRILLFLIIFLPILMNSALLINRGADSGYLQFAALLIGIILILYVYAMVRLLMRVNHLRKSL